MKSFASHIKKPKMFHVSMVLGGALVFILFSSSTFLDTTPEPYLLKYPSYFGNRFKIPENNPMTNPGVKLGRMLFYEKRLSSNNQVSCASCHQQKRAFTDGKAFSIGTNAQSPTRRNSMSLANLLWVQNYFWDGRASSLEEQAKFPLTDPHEMNQELSLSVKKLQSSPLYKDMFNKAYGSPVITTKGILKSLAQFQRTLISADSKYDRYLQNKYQPNAAELRGMNLFQTRPQPAINKRGANCVHCHGTPKTYKELFHNNGLDTLWADLGRMEHTGRVIDKGRFRVPTLRNIERTAPYMHDGRFQTLEAVLDHYSDHIKESATLSPFIRQTSNAKGSNSLHLTQDEKKDIIAFLKMLTDTTFINNPKFSNPFKIETSLDTF